jgi:hypothetical protein
MTRLVSASHVLGGERWKRKNKQSLIGSKGLVTLLWPMGITAITTAQIRNFEALAEVGQTL